MKMKLTGILFFATILLTACGGSATEEQTEERPNSIKITGKVSGADGKKVAIWVYENKKERKVDSTVVENGTFTLWTDTKELRQYVVQVGENSNELVYLFPDEEADEIVIEGGVPGLYRNYKIEGDQNSIDYQEYWAYILPYLDKEQQLFKEYENTNPADTIRKNEIMAELDSMFVVERQYAIDYIQEKPASPVSWIMLQEFYPPSGIANFDTADLDYFDLVATEMRAKYPYSEYPELIEMSGENVLTQMDAAAQSANLGEGMAPELAFPNPDGEVIALSSLRGKVVLIDFWASWCGPCRMENPNVVKTYEKYKDKGFTIYSVSLDQDKNAWIKAIDADNLSWPNHVSDLKGWQSAAAAKYNVNSIPATFLIDEEGRIIDQNLRGPALEQKLQQILG